MLEKVFITSFIVFAIHGTMEEGNIFEFVQKWYFKATKKWSEEKADFYSKPLFSCAFCMTAWYGSLLYWLIWHVSWQQWILVVMSAMGLSLILIKLFPEKN